MEGQNNRLIESLTPESRQSLLAAGRRVDLAQSTVLFEPDVRTEHAYFLMSGVASQVVTVVDGGSAEISMQGNEGIIGAMDLLGTYPPVAQCLMQTSGTAIRVPMSDMQRLFASSAEIRRLLLESIQQQVLTLNQIAACNKLHRASERLARWLLTAADRTGSDTVNLTQESLAAMLGTRRTTVALVAGTLQRSGMIRYRRGTVNIVNREELTSGACDCYGILKRLVDGLYQDRSTTQPGRKKRRGTSGAGALRPGLPRCGVSACG